MQTVIEAHADIPVAATITASRLSHCFGQGIPHEAGIAHAYHDVIEDTRALYEMIARVKPIIGPKTPVTVPQIWIDGGYVGGASELQEILGLAAVEPNPERGQCSLSPLRRAHA